MTFKVRFTDVNIYKYFPPKYIGLFWITDRHDNLNSNKLLLFRLSWRVTQEVSVNLED